MHGAAFGIEMQAGVATRKVMHSFSVAAATLNLLRSNRCFTLHRLTSSWCRADCHGSVP